MKHGKLIWIQTSDVGTSSSPDPAADVGFSSLFRTSCWSAAVADVVVVTEDDGDVTGDDDESSVTQIIGSGSVDVQTGTQELRRPVILDPAPPACDFSSTLQGLSSRPFLSSPPACDDLRRRDDEATDPDRFRGDPERCRHVAVDDDLVGDVPTDDCCCCCSASSCPGSAIICSWTYNDSSL